MTRRYQMIDVPRPKPWTWIDTVLIIVVSIIALGAMLFILGVVLATKPLAHESWINRGGFKNTGGEWCCGDYDCKSYKQASSTSTGWMVDGEFVPFDEAMPIAPPDGQLTVCRRPDGSRRCVFGLKPGL